MRGLNLRLSGRKSKKLFKFKAISQKAYVLDLSARLHRLILIQTEVGERFEGAEFEAKFESFPDQLVHLC